jgi:hypothetical protein
VGCDPLAATDEDALVLPRAFEISSMLPPNDVIDVVEAIPIKAYFGFEVECFTSIVEKRLKDRIKLWHHSQRGRSRWIC